MRYQRNVNTADQTETACCLHCDCIINAATRGRCSASDTISSRRQLNEIVDQLQQQAARRPTLCKRHQQANNALELNRHKSIYIPLYPFTKYYSINQLVAKWLISRLQLRFKCGNCRLTGEVKQCFGCECRSTMFNHQYLTWSANN